MSEILKETKYIMNKYNIRANKSLGQNFLINEEVVKNIVESSSICSEDLVIEIGPGLGTLTKELLEKAGKVIAVELDKKMVTILEDRFKMYDNIEIIQEDILKVNLQEIIKKEKQNGKIKYAKIVANLPYYITTPIIEKIINSKVEVEGMVLMVQDEVADRLCAIPGSKNYGYITVYLNYYFNLEKLFTVDRSSFEPVPNVDSAVIKLSLKENRLIVNDEDKFFEFVKDAFKMKRKNLKNNLRKYDLDKINNVLGKIERKKYH